MSMEAPPLSDAPLAPSTDGAGSQTKRQRVAKAAGRLVVHALLNSYDNASVNALTVEEKEARSVILAGLRQHADPPIKKTRALTNRLLRRCSCCFRASASTDERVTKFRYLLTEAYRCKQRDYDLVNVVDIGGVYKAFSADHEIRKQYGAPGNMDAAAAEVHAAFNKAFRFRSALINTITTHKLLVDDTQLPNTVGDAVRMLAAKLQAPGSLVPPNIRSRFWTLVVKADEMMVSAKAQSEHFEARVNAHVSERLQTTQCFMSHDFLGVDLVTLIAEYVGFFGASSMLAVSTSFARDETIKKLLPHLTFRPVSGRFPHGQQYVPDFGQCDVVRKNSQVHLYIDLVVTGMKRSGQRTETKQHADGLCGWSSDPVDERKDRNFMREDALERRYRTVEEVAPNDGYFHMRLSAKQLFHNELVCERIALVFADTHEEVSEVGGLPPIHYPHRMAIRKTRLHTYTAKDGVPYPAYTTLSIMQDAVRDVRRLYKFKVVASGVSPSSSGSSGNAALSRKTLVSYSTPFAIVSNQYAFKRPRSPTEASR